MTYLQAASDLEQSGQLESARRAYTTALHAWPDQAAARFGLGNVAWSENQTALALTEYRRLVSDFPGLKAGWNNLAVALEAVGCKHAAELAVACANDEVAPASWLQPVDDPAICSIPACP